MPPVREVPAEAAAPLERVEVRPGVFLKLNSTDKARYAQMAADEEAARSAYLAITQPAPEGEPTEDWKRADIDAYAESKGIDTTGAPNKAAAIALIEEGPANG